MMVIVIYGDCLFKNGGETPIGASLQITTSHDGLEMFFSFVRWS